MIQKMTKYLELVDRLIEETYLTTPRIIDAFRKTPRRPFLTKTHQPLEALNSPLPIGQGQTISQPLTVAFMLELLQPKAGDTILDIGYGSGWQTALLARIVCPEKASKSTCGSVIAYEIISDVADFGEKNIDKALPQKLRSRISLHKHDYRYSFKKHSPYDKMISAAAFPQTPTELIKSLKNGGIIVYPTQARDIRKITRTDDNSYTEDVYPGFTFVPITH